MKTLRERLVSAKKLVEAAIAADGTNICANATLEVLGGGRSVIDCFPEYSSPKKRGSNISTELARTGMYTAAILPINDRTKSSDIELAISQPRALIRESGYRQPNKINGSFILFESINAGDDHMAAVLPAKDLPRNERREFRNKGPHVLVDTSQPELVIRPTSDHLVEYCREWRKQGYNTTLWVVGSGKTKDR